MFELYELNGADSKYELVTLKEAKENCVSLIYNNSLDENTLGTVKSKPYGIYEKFYPIEFKGKLIRMIGEIK